MGEEDRAIVVGVSEYPELGALRGPENDANEFYKWLRSPHGGNVPEGRIDLIISSKFKPFKSPELAEPTRLRVREAFMKLYALAERQGRDGDGTRIGRRLYLYFAGHGFAPFMSSNSSLADSDKVALLMANATRERVDYHFLGPYGAEWAKQAAMFDEIMLFMDCCREAYASPALFTDLPEIFAQEEDVARVKIFYGYATKWSRAAREFEVEQVWRGVFTRALIKALEVAVDPATKQITGNSLYSGLKNHMSVLMRESDRADASLPYEPDIRQDFDERVVADPPPPPPEGLFARLRDERPITIFTAEQPVPKFPVRLRFDNPAYLNQPAEIHGGKPFRARASAVAGPAPWPVELERGFYVVLVGGVPRENFEVSGFEGLLPGGARDVQVP
jgi:hypothetical protein